MKRFGEHTMQEIINSLEDLLSLPVKQAKRPLGPGPVIPDLVVKAGPSIFAIEFKSSSYLQSLAPLLKFIELTQPSKWNMIFILCVPFMGPGGKELCDKYGINWFDLSGNGRIALPHMRIHVEGKPNLYKKRGRKPNLFAPKSSRLMRYLISHSTSYISQRELSTLVDVDEGYVSTVTRKLEEFNLIERNQKNELRLPDPNLLLKSWVDAYDFNRHRIIKGHTPARSGVQLFNNIADYLNNESVPYASTGLAAAWQYTHFATFRIVSVYLKNSLSEQQRNDIGFVDDPEGANTWLIIPNDEGVFDGSQEIAGIRCASPLQTYLDLKGHPERSKEAAEELRKHHLRWDSDDG